MKRTNHGRNTRREPRGIAMLLVLVAMVVAVVLTSAAIVSRETSPEMGENATASVSASWSAESAANYAVGVLAKGFNWTAAMGSDGTLVDDMTVGGASVHVVLTDLDGNVPDANDRDLCMIATATVNGIETTVRRMVSLGAPGDPIDGIDPLLGEFALFGTDELTVGSGASIGVWPLSPEAASRPQVNLGASFQSAGNMAVDLNGAQAPIGLFADRNGDAGLLAKMLSTLNTALTWQVPLSIPTLAIGVPSAVMVALPAKGDYDSPNNAVAGLAIGNYGRIRVRNSATITMDGTAPVAFRCDRLELDNGMLRIVGDVSIFVRDRCRVENNAKIVLANADASLKIYVCDEMEIDGGSQLGVLQSDAGRAPTALQTWVSPSKVQILEVSTADGGSGSTNITVQGSSTMLANVHVPGGAVTITDGGTLIGRATGAQMHVENTAHVLYDPTLDNRVGFTNADGPLYEADGSANPAVEQAIDDALASSGNDAGMFLTLLRTAYDNLSVFTGGLGESNNEGGIVQQTVNLFTALTGIF